MAYIFGDSPNTGVLYYRSPKIMHTPLVIINPNTLEEIDFKLSFDANAPNCIFSEFTNPEIGINLNLYLFNYMIKLLIIFCC